MGPAYPHCMKALSPWVLGVLLLPLTAAAGRAADTTPRIEEIESWRESAKHPEDFQHLVEGSILHRGGPQDPGYTAAVNVNEAARRAPRLLPTHEDVRHHRDAIPRPESFDVPASANLEADSDYWLIGAGLIAFGGVCLLLAWNAGRGAVALEPRPVGIYSPRAFGSSPAWAPSTAPAGSPVATATPPELPTIRERPFVDSCLPAHTWRAINWREQALIERWDSSQERALGLASLDEWLDRQGAVAGVDTTLLMAKLDRDVA